MRTISGTNLASVAAALAVAVSAATIGCSSDREPQELTALSAGALISQKWAQDELNHFRISFHSDTLVECGVKNDLWKLAEISDRGYTWTAYRLTEKGSKVLFAIDLKESGKGHAITLRGPYRFDVTRITPGSDPDSRNVEFHWEIDWNKAPDELKTCIPKFELSGSEIALFKLSGRNWTFVSYSNPEDAPAPPASAALEKLP